MPRRLDREKDVKEYNFDGKTGPMDSLSNSANEPRPMDEISMLKRGLTDKHGHNLHSKRGKPYVETVTPINLQELTTRGMVLDNGEIIYSLPGQGQPHELELPSEMTSGSTLSPVSSELSAKKSISEAISTMTLIEPATNMCTFQVGLPTENAFLTMGDTKHGKRYDLSIGDDFQFILMDTDKTTSIVVFNT